MCGVLPLQHCGSSTVKGNNEDVIPNGSGTRVLLCLNFNSVDRKVFQVLGKAGETTGPSFCLEVS